MTTSDKSPVSSTPSSDSKKELSTDQPLSEKDEVKQAEENTAQSVPKESVAADLKNREKHNNPEQHK